jgi:PAS domain S-box-containing protein
MPIDHQNSVRDLMNTPDGFFDTNGGMWQLLVDSVVDYAIYFLDLDGTIRSWNGGAQRIKGYSADEIVGSNFSLFYTDEDIRAGEPARSLEIARSVGRFEAQGWRVRKDGTRLWADVVIDVVRNPAGEVVGFAKVTRDLTQRALRAGTKDDDGSGKVLVDNILDYAVFLLDLDGTVKSWNVGAERIKGYSAQEIIGSNFSVFYTADDVSAGEPIRCLEIARTTGRFEGTGWRVRRDGKRIWTNVVIDVVRDPAGAVAGFAKITRDLTQSAALRAVSEENGSIAQTLVDNVVDYAIYLLDLDGTVKSWNAGAQRIKGYSAEEIIGRNFSAFYTDDDVRAGEPAKSLAIARATGRFAAEGWRVRKDRTRLWASVMIDAVRDPAGEVVGFAKVTRDITQSAAVQYLTEQLRIEREQFLVAKKSADEAAARAIASAEHDRMTTAKLADKNRLMAMAERMAHVGHWRFDVVSGDLYWSEEVYRTLGIPLAHKPTLDEAISTYHPVDRERVGNTMEKAMSEGTPIAYEARIVRPDATVREVVCSGQAEYALDGTIAAIFGVFQDVTEARDAERERQRLAELSRVQRSNDLAAINELMAMAQEMTSVGYWHFDLRSRERQWSDEVYRIFGMAPGDPVPTEAVPNAYAGEDRERIAGIVESTKASGSAYGFETRLTRPDGTVRDVVVTGRVERATDGTPLVLKGAIQDVTDRKNMARDRDRLIMRVGLATQVAQVGIWDWDIVTNDIVWDPMMFALYGFDDAHFSPMYERWTGALHPDDRARAEREIAQAAATGSPFETEFRIVWPDGEIHHIQATATVVCDAAGAPRRMVGTNWDITEVRTLEEHLRAAAARDRATTAVMAEKNRLMAMAEQLAHVGHWRLDVQSNEVYWSDELYRTFGLPTTFKPTLQNALAVYHPDDRERVSTVVEQAIASGMPYTSESRIVRPDGSVRHVVSTGQPEYAADGSTIAVFGVFHDVTETKDAERERLRLLERVRVAAQAGNVGIWEWDLRTDGVVWDATMFALYGLAEQPGPQTAELWKRAFHPDDEAPITRAIADAIHGRTLLDVEYRVLWPSGEMHHLRCRGMVTAEAGVPVRMLGTAWDITEVRRLAIELHEEKERLLTERAALLARTTELRELSTLQRAILTDAAVGIITTDIDGTITLFNPAAERMLGYAAEEIVGRTTPAPFHDRAEVEARAAALTAELETVVRPGFEVFIVKARQGVSDSNEWTYIRKDGTRFPALLSATALRDDDDNVFGYLGMVVDQTELQSEKKRLLETVDMWMAAKQVADDATRAKSNFLANMSHEIRTPMNGIIGLTSLLLDVDLAPEHEAHLKLIADAGRSLLAIINDILDLSKVEAGKIDLEAIPLSPAGIVGGALALVRGEALKKDIALDIAIAPDVPDWVNGDPTRLRQILLNLLSNAIKFTQRGRVAITVRCEPHTGSDVLRFEISDTGIGIAPESLHLLFEKFSQVDRSDARKFGGSGLGLAISRRLAEAMSGTIGVTSEVGAGSVFWFTAQLPPTAPPARSTVAARRRTDVVARRILLVDDNPLNQIVARAMLEKDGHDVVVVADGLEALAAVQERTFDLVLMDMQMPVMDGMEAARRIRDLDTVVREIPIVALTANVMAEEIASCREAGMNDHLAKPIDRDGLRQIIATWACRTDSSPAQRSEN